MLQNRILILAFIVGGWSWGLSGVYGQGVVLNEGSNRNATTIADEDGDYPDWVELYNGGGSAVSLAGYFLSDDPLQPQQWAINGLNLSAGAFQIIFCSGKNISSSIHHWETAADQNTLYRYEVPTAATAAAWYDTAFVDTAWQQGYAGFGYGDGDDATLLSDPTAVVYARALIHIPDTAKIGEAILHVDYDDGFIAYFNGVEIARSNMSLAGWNSLADGQHEAALYTGGIPEAFPLDMALLRSLWQQGDNVLAIEGHNVTSNSTDLSLIPFLTFGITDNSTFFNSPPAWFGSSNARYHTNFKISSDGETLYLFDPLGVLVDTLPVGYDLDLDYSDGKTTDGAATVGIFTTPTPGNSNNSATAYTNGYEPQPSFSLPAGFYSNTIQVTISSSSPSAAIRYTTDGQEPTLASPLYTAPVILPFTAVLKAKAFSTGNKLPSAATTATYFFGGTMSHSVPVISLTVNDADLYGSNGIIDNWWTDWKRHCHVEYFDANGQQLQFAQDAAIKIEGGAGGSRSQPQSSFRIELEHGTFGDGAVQYPLMAARPNRMHWDAFYLRNGSNMYQILPTKDAVIVEGMGKGTYNNYQAYNCVAVYLNGAYWGTYELREKQDADYFEQNYGADRDSLHILGLSYWYGSILRQVEGTGGLDDIANDFAAVQTINPADIDYWQQVDQHFDLNNYTDYVIAQQWTPNTDWPQNNIKLYKGDFTQDKWRFGLIDLELSFNPYGWVGWDFDNIARCIGFDPNNDYIHLWQTTMQNNVYHDYYINRFADLMNSRYLQDTLAAIGDRIFDESYPEMGYQYERWGDGSMSAVDFMAQYEYMYNILIDDFANRTPEVRNQIQTNFALPQQVTVFLDVQPAGAGYIKISTLAPTDYPWSGVYFDGVPVKIEAVPHFGYTFSHWTNNGLVANVADSVFWDTISLPMAPFIAHFQQTLQVSTDVTISEINYNSEPSIAAGDWVEFWNESPVGTASLAGWYFTDNNATHRYDFPSGLTLAPDERVVVVADTAAFRQQFPAVPYVGIFNFGLGSTSDAVRLYNAQNQLVKEVVYADTLPWALGADGQGYTLELDDPQAASFGNASNWFAGCLGGSPAAPFSPCSLPILFSEINYKGNLGILCGDWVELRNRSGANMDLSGWTFRDEVDSLTHIFTLPGGTILADQSNLVIAENLSLFAAVHPAVSNVIGSTGFGFSATGEWLRLYDQNGILRQSVRYDNNLPWAVVGDGYTLEFMDSTVLVNEGGNWFEGCYGGSPGAFYDPNCTVATSPYPTAFSGLWSAYPNPTDAEMVVEYSGAGATMAATQGRLLDIHGKTVQAFEWDGTLRYSLSLQTLSAGVYYLQLTNTDKSQTLKIVKQ